MPKQCRFISYELSALWEVCSLSIFLLQVRIPAVHQLQFSCSKVVKSAWFDLYFYCYYPYSFNSLYLYILIDLFLFLDYAGKNNFKRSSHVKTKKIIKKTQKVVSNKCNLWNGFIITFINLGLKNRFIHYLTTANQK